jgi:hypothetical protein
MKLRTLLMLSMFTAAVAAEEDGIQLETTRIKANKELPQILYIVPWKDFEAPTGKEQKLKLHNFFDDLYEPILATKSSKSDQQSN